MAKSLSNKYSQKLPHSAKKIYNRGNKKYIKREIQKTAKLTGDLIDNKFADKITSISKKSTKELPKNETNVDVEKATLKKRYISPEEGDNKLLMN